MARRRLTDGELEALARITNSDVARALVRWKRAVPVALRNLLEAKKAPAKIRAKPRP